MRISDWISDVCSSDLDDPGLVRIGETRPIPALHQFAPRLLARLGRLDHAMPLIGMDRLAGAARRQCLRGVALPVLMLPAYGGVLGRAVPLREASDRRAGRSGEGRVGTESVRAGRSR